MKAADSYVDLDGNQFALAGLSPEERRLIAGLRRRAKLRPDWSTFANYWTVAIPAFYQARGMARLAVPRTLGWRIAQDLSARLGIAAGVIRPSDYRDELEGLILEHFRSPRAFCKATGLSEEAVNQVLAGRQGPSLEALARALERIGYRLRIAPAPARQPSARPRKRTG
jgi:transcriptional regulator with XRE-family HTH domain